MPGSFGLWSCVFAGAARIALTDFIGSLSSYLALGALLIVSVSPSRFVSLYISCSVRNSNLGGSRTSWFGPGSGRTWRLLSKSVTNSKLRQQGQARPGTTGTVNTRTGSLQKHVLDLIGSGFGLFVFCCTVR